VFVFIERLLGPKRTISPFNTSALFTQSKPNNTLTVFLMQSPKV
jgi:hypothetical protein